MTVLTWVEPVWLDDVTMVIVLKNNCRKQIAGQLIYGDLWIKQPTEKSYLVCLGTKR